MIVNRDVLVSIRSWLLMIEAQRMHKLVHDCTWIYASWCKGYGLRSVTQASDVTPTSALTVDQDKIKSYLLFCKHKEVLQVKDTHRENTRWNETKALTKSMNIRIWEIGTLNQLFKRGSYTEIEFSEKINSDKSAFFLIGPLCTTHSISLKIDFWLVSLYGNVALSIESLSTKKPYSSFSKKVFVFQKTCIKVKTLKRSKSLVTVT